MALVVITPTVNKTSSSVEKYSEPNKAPGIIPIPITPYANEIAAKVSIPAAPIAVEMIKKFFCCKKIFCHLSPPNFNSIIIIQLKDAVNRQQGIAGFYKLTKPPFRY